MKRQVMDSLVTWKKSQNRSFLLLRGAARVGKTWILKEFGEQEFTSSAYISFRHNRRMERLFEGDLSPQLLLQCFEMEAGVPIKADTLLILDDVEYIPGAASALVRLSAQKPEYAIVAACSTRNSSAVGEALFPVRKVDILDMYPMTFMEFLEASAEGRLLYALKIHNFDLLHVFGDKLLDLLRKYLFVGGMPEAVRAYIKTGDPAAVRCVQKRILDDIVREDFAKAPRVISKKLSGIWESIPDQLVSGNRRFLFTRIRKGARAEEFGKPLMWLSDAGLVLSVPRTENVGIPLMAPDNCLAYRLFYLDVGLLGAACGAGKTAELPGERESQGEAELPGERESQGAAELPGEAEIQGNAGLVSLDGPLLRQYVCQEMTAAGFPELFFWSAVNSIGDVDFLFESAGFVVPIEVQAKENLKAKNLKSFCDRFRVGKSMRFSASDYRDETFLTNVPLYAIGWMAEFPKKK